VVNAPPDKPLIEADPSTGLDRLAQWPALLAVVALGGVLLSGFAYREINRAETERNAAVVERRAEQLQAVLAGRVREYRLAAWYLANQADTLSPTNRAGFERLARGLLKRLPELRAIQWAPWVPAAERARFEALRRAGGLPGFAVREAGSDGVPAVAGEREGYCPLYFREPPAAGAWTPGLDLLTGPGAQEVEAARDSGRGRLSAPVSLQGSGADQTVVVFTMPYYRALKEGASQAERRRAFGGVFQMVFHCEKMFAALLRSRLSAPAQDSSSEQTAKPVSPVTTAGTDGEDEAFAGMDLLVADGSSGEAHGRVFGRWAPMRGDRLEGPDLTAMGEGLRAERAVEFGGRYWRVLLRACPEYLRARHTQYAVGALSSGLAFTALLLAYVLMLQRKSREVENLVRGRTMDLERSFRQLEQRQERLKNVNEAMSELARVDAGKDFDFERVLKRYCELTAGRFEIDRVGVWLHPSGGVDLRCECMFLLKAGRWARGRVLTAGEFPGFFEALEAGAPIAAVNARLDRRTEGMRREYLEPENIFSLLAAPIVRSGKVVGMVSFEALGGHRRWAQEELTMAGALADFVALALTDAERADAEGRLRESERLYHSLVENLPQFVFRKDREGRFTFVNEQLAESLSRPVEKILGRTDADLMPPELAAKYRQDDARVMEKGEVLEFVEECELPGGRVYLHTCKTPIRDEAGDIVGVQGIAWDITERYRLQAALNASDERFRKLVDSLECIVWEADPLDLKVSFVSKQAEKILGYPTGVWMDDEAFWTNRIHAEDRRRVLNEYREVARTGQDKETEYRMIAADGRTVWVRDIVSVERGEDGRPGKLRGLMIDITEARRMQSELHESTERMRLFIQHTPTSVAMFDRNMNYILASRKWYEDNGLVGRDITGKSHYEVVPDIPERWRRIHQHCLSGNSAECDEDRFERADGRVDYVRWELHPWHQKNGEVGGIIMFSEIITDRVKARLAIERSEAILQATGRAAELFLKAETWSDAVVEVMEHLGDATRVGRISLFENQFRHGEGERTRLRFEWFADQGARDVSVGDARHFDWSDRRIRRWRDTLAAGGIVKGRRADFTDEEREFIGLDAIKSLLVIPLRVRGQWWGVMSFDAYDEEREWNAAEVGALKGAVDNLCAAIERELAESERIQIERRMQDSQRLESLGVLAGGIAHEFNNLLTAILGNAGLIRLELEEGSPLAEPIEVIEKTSMRAADLCKQMLAYAGKGRFEMARLELNELVADTTDLLRVSLSKKAELEIKLQDDLPRVLADASQLQQIIMNLVINASEAIGDEPGRITVSTDEARLEEKDFDSLLLGAESVPEEVVRLTVSDTGEGMTPDTLKRAFDPFFTTKFTGRGLGLAAVQGIITGHGGGLRVRTEPGQGSTFEVFLPVADRSAGKRAGPVEGAASLPEGLRVLVVDDEEAVRNVAASFLRRWGAEVTTADDGRAGVEAFQRAEGGFDLVLMDYLMPQMNGVEAAREMKALRRDARILMMSGFNEASSVERHEDAGLAGFLQKPFPRDKLRSAIARALNGRAAAVRD